MMSMSMDSHTRPAPLLSGWGPLSLRFAFNEPEKPGGPGHAASQDPESQECLSQWEASITIIDQSQRQTELIAPS